MWTATWRSRTSTPPSWGQQAPVRHRDGAHRRPQSSGHPGLLCGQSGPFLTQNFSEIHLFDPRYNLNSVQEYAAQNEIDSIVVLYSISNFTAKDNQLFVLGR